MAQLNYLMALVNTAGWDDEEYDREVASRSTTLTDCRVLFGKEKWLEHLIRRKIEEVAFRGTENW